MGPDRSTTATRVSDLLEQWFQEEPPGTLGSLIERFGERSFALVFVVLLGLPALPLPTGGVTHVFEVVAMLVALQLVAGRRSIWLPERLKRVDLRARGKGRLAGTLVSRVRWLERLSRPRLPSLTQGQASGRVFGLLVFAFTLAAFLAPPFSGLDTLPALGVVVLSLGVLLADVLIVVLGTAIGSVGVVLVVGFGALVVDGVRDLL